MLEKYWVSGHYGFFLHDESNSGSQHDWSPRLQQTPNALIQTVYFSQQWFKSVDGSQLQYWLDGHESGGFLLVQHSNSL